MTSYPYTSLYVNGREALLQDIFNGAENPHNDFERDSFDFIREWFGGRSEFEIQTSGSTGTPKQIRVSRYQMIASAKLTQSAIGLQAGYRALVCLDTRYIAGKMMLVRSFVTGMEIILQTPSSNPLADLPVPVDFVALVPYQVYAILESETRLQFNAINTIIVGGAPLRASTVSELQSYSTRFYTTYGMTETISHIALKRLNGNAPDTAFRVLPGVIIGQDARQCLTITVPYLPEKQITNDIVEIIGQDKFIWLGRADNVINSGGVKIIPEKVERVIGDAFRDMQLDSPFFISSLPDEKLGNSLVLFVEGEKFSEQSQLRLFEILRNALQPYELPRAVYVVGKFEMTETGKINRLRTVQNIDKTIQNFTLKK